MMGTISQGIEPGAADALLNLLDLIANPDRAKALAQDMRDSAAALNAARDEARASKIAADMAHDDAVERLGAAVDAEKKANAALDKLKAARADADERAAKAKAEIAADRRTLKAECDAAAVAAGDLRAERTAFEEQRAHTAAADKRASDDIARANLALDAREAAVAAGEADMAERLAKLRALAG